LDANTTGTNNISMGRNALGSNTTGSSNVAVGDGALIGNTTANANSAFGSDALSSNSTGANNTAIGNSALQSNTTASNNTAVGYQALYTNATGAGLTAVGYQSFYLHNGSGTQENTGLGAQSGYATTSGYDNTFIGYIAGYSNTTGYTNTAIGGRALYTNTTGVGNISMGYQSLYFNTTGASNTALGNQALQANTTASYQTAVGYQAGYAATGNGNTLIGHQAGYRVSTGTRNTFIGVGGTDDWVGGRITTGGKNTIIGGYSGNQGGLDITTASNYIVLSDGDGNPRGIFDSSGRFLVGTTSHSDGSMFQSASTALNGYRTIATSSGGVIAAYSDVGGTKTVRAYITADGGLTNYSANNVNLSDERLKKDIVLAGNYLDKLCAIPVKNFRYKDQDASEDITLGVIAQDVQAVAPELINTDGFGVDETKADYLAVYQTDLQYAMLKAIQELKAEVDSLKQQINNGV
jgi:hypothetical protein